MGIFGSNFALAFEVVEYNYKIEAGQYVNFAVSSAKACEYSYLVEGKSGNNFRAYIMTSDNSVHFSGTDCNVDFNFYSHSCSGDACMSSNGKRCKAKKTWSKSREIVIWSES